MVFTRMRVLAAALSLCAGIASPAFTISNFILDNEDELNAIVRWDPKNPGTFAGCDMVGFIEDGDGDRWNNKRWTDHNGGVAFLDIFRIGSRLEIHTWGTDTNGHYGPEDVDIFTVPIDLTQAFGHSFVVSSPHGVYDYHFIKLWSDPYSFRIHAGKYLWTNVPDTGLTVGMLGAAVGALLIGGRRWRR